MESPAGEIARAVVLAERMIGKAMDRALAVLGTSAAQRPVLEALWDVGETSPAELAKAARVEGPPMSRMLKRMERAGLIKRREDPKDGRRQLVSLTPKGERLREYLPGVADGVMTKALVRLDPDRLSRLRVDLAALIQAFEEAARHRP
ncbi:MAG: winged helix DNA-binding protein [bacterium]|nr:winged helix DNA-binding protein [bacterium]